MSTADQAPKDFTAYSIGLVNAFVCTSLSDDQAATRLNAEHPTGIESRWALATDEPNSVPCYDHADTHRHLLFVC